MVSDPVNWWAEARNAVIVATFVALLGSVVGVLWHAVAPQIGIVTAAQGSTATTKALIGDDLWLGLLGAIAGIVCVLGLIVVAPDASRGPGAVLGLGAGGLLGMFVAARVGHLIGHHDLRAVFVAHYPTVGDRLTNLVLHYFDFRVRAKSVLFTWPVVSLVLHAATVGVRAANQPTRRMVSAYPGSS